MADREDIRAFTCEELAGRLTAIGEKPFRARQVYEWLWNKGAGSFGEMSSLPLALREKLAENYCIRKAGIEQTVTSSDGTVKSAVGLYDGLLVESVLIPAESRITACVSSQVGCAMGCLFCATATLGRTRNLTAGEIYDQVRIIGEQSKEIYGRELSNIVLMGMGEPLMNFGEVMRAIELITSEKGLGMSSRRITLSTVGIPDRIREMADRGVKFNLAVSLHSAIDEKRSAIIPTNRTYPLAELADALGYWYGKTKSPVTFEYVVWERVNDGDADIDALIRYARRIPSKVNLIEYNPTGDGKFAAAEEKTMQRHVERLERANITVMVRHSRGRDIAAACGQLAGKNNRNENNCKKGK